MNKRLIKEFRRLVSIDAPSFGERKMADYLRSRLTELGFSVEEDDAGSLYGGNCGNLYAFRKGNLPGEPLLFSMHMDTVEPCSGFPIRKSTGSATCSGATLSCPLT